jgi:hypothetical protein
LDLLRRGIPGLPCACSATRSLYLTDVPSDLQARFAIDAVADVTLAQADGGGYRDGLRLPSGRFVSLQELRPGIHAYIPVLLENRGLERVEMTLESHF